MAFIRKDLTVLGYANGFTLWNYQTNDASVTAANYFNAGADMVKKGDMIAAVIDIDGSISGAILLVTANNGTSVTVAAI